MKQAYLFLIFICLIPNLLNAGGVSGGGVVFNEFDLGPWFNENDTITYCVNAKLTQDNIKELNTAIQFGFKYWKNQFKDAISTTAYPTNHIEFSYRNFYQNQKLVMAESCNQKNVNLVFQIGILNENQKKELPNDRTHIAAAYTKKEHGKNGGFIFISDLIYESKDENKKFSLQFLNIAIIHELGHVFGIRHVDRSVMDERLLSEINKTKKFPDFLNYPHQDISSLGFFIFHDSVRIIEPALINRKVWSIISNDNDSDISLVVKASLNAKNFSLANLNSLKANVSLSLPTKSGLALAKGWNRETIEIEELKFSKMTADPSACLEYPFSHLARPEEIYQLSLMFTGIIFDTHHKRVPVYVTFKPGSGDIEILSIIDGEITSFVETSPHVRADSFH